MTTIAYRDGVLVADTKIARGDSVCGRVVKIAKRADGAVGGASGDATFMYAFLEWMRGERSERPAPDREGGSAVVITPDGRIEQVEFGGSFFVEAPYWALGSGRPEALGAMFVGADAETAVRAAMAHDAFTGGDLTILRLGANA